MSAGLQLSAAAEFLAAARQHKPADLPRIRIDREDAELRRQLGQVLDIAGEATAVAGLLCDAVAAVVYELDATEVALVLDALEFAAECRRYRAWHSACDACARSAEYVCGDHATDVVRAAEYDDLAGQIREATR